MLFGPFENSNPLKNLFVASNPLQDVLMKLVSELFSTDQNSDRKLQAGDVVGVSRGIYDHYGVYIGNKKIIHYTSPSSDISSENRIIETSFDVFLKGDVKYHILNLEYLEPKKYPQLHDVNAMVIIANTNGMLSDALQMWRQFAKREVFSPEETIQRAKSRLGEDKYNLLLNNCEHFAVWCKTGLSASFQIQKLLAGTPRIIIDRFD